jgi:hypothetical protein
MAYVYIHKRKDNNQPFYIGVGGLISFDNYQRALAKNKKGLRARSQFWYNYVNLYGLQVDIILDNCTPEEAFQKERELIQLYGRQDINTGILVNHTNGGEGGKGYSDETKRKCGVQNIGKVPSQATIEKIKQGLKNRPPDSILTKQKRANTLKGRKLSTDHIEKIRKFSPFKLGHIPWNKNKKWTKRGIFLVLNLENGIFYESINEAASSKDFKYSTLRAALRGQYKTNNTAFIIC